ncbi:Sensor protein [Candida maltosa Xu316]|uniref:Sensor protein n=1 Tax=Candida maltosa (strain Xu316) TaxID=1245528 RepID=M3JWF8_CANMX|nr:Sensor protein [Candida maltosa Xu316]
MTSSEMTSDQANQARSEIIAAKLKEFDRRFKELYLESKKLELINLLLRTQLDKLVERRDERPANNLIDTYKQIQSFQHSAKLFVRLEKLGNKKLQNLSRGLKEYNRDVEEFYDEHGIVVQS